MGTTLPPGLYVYTPPAPRKLVTGTLILDDILCSKDKTKI